MFLEEIQKNISININVLYALCELENYDDFSNELEEILKFGENLNFKLYDIVQGKFILGNKKIKQFVKKYQKEINIMKKYNCTNELLINKYDSKGNIYNSSFDIMFKYIRNNKDKISQIKNMLDRISDLGFKNIKFNEQLNFTNTEYTLSKTFLYQSEFQLVDNIEIIPTYNNEEIKYKTNESNYCITINQIKYNKEITLYLSEIELNSLIFDYNKLPDKIDYDSTASQIIKKSDYYKNDYQTIKKCIDMNISIEELINQYKLTKQTLKSINDINNNEELKQILKNIIIELSNLRKFNKKIEKEMIDKSKYIDKEELKKEKIIYLKKQ